MLVLNFRRSHTRLFIHNSMLNDSSHIEYVEQRMWFWIFILSAGTEVHKLDKPLLKVSDVITRQMSAVHKHLEYITCVRLYSQVHLLSQTRSGRPEQEHFNEFTNRRRSLQIIQTLHLVLTVTSCSRWMWTSSVNWSFSTQKFCFRALNQSLSENGVPIMWSLIMNEWMNECVCAGNYRTQLYDKQREEYLPATQGLGMFVEVKDPDEKVKKKIHQLTIIIIIILRSWLKRSVCLLQVILSRQYGSEGRFTFTSHTPGEHQICLHSNSSKFSLFAGGMLVRRPSHTVHPVSLNPTEWHFVTHWQYDPWIIINIHQHKFLTHLLPEANILFDYIYIFYLNFI